MSSRTRGRRRRVVPNIIGILVFVVWVFPLYWMLNTSFKTTDNLLSANPSFLPIPFTVDNFVDAATRPGFWTSMANSVMVAVCVVGVSLILGFFAAAAVSRYYFRGRGGVLVVIIVVQMIPAAAMLIPVFLTLKDLNLLNNYLGLGLAYVCTALPFTIWMLRGFFVALPAEIEEAAEIDGASTGQILRRIYLPLMAPGIVTTSVFSFIAAWNDYIVAYVLLSRQSMYTFPVWMVGFANKTIIDYGGLIAASVLFTVPVVIFFLSIKRNLVSGLSAGAVKG